MQWRNVQANAFEALIAIMCVIAAIGAFADPASLRDSVVGQELHPWDFLWNGMFGVSGILILVGLLNPERTYQYGRVRIEGAGAEIAGLIFLGTAVAINGAAAIAVNGLSPGIGILTAVVFACIYRVRALLAKEKEIVPVTVPEGKP